jgi:hypothetical protein
MRWALLLLGCAGAQQPIAPPVPAKPTPSVAPKPMTEVVEIDGTKVEAVPFVATRYANRTDIAVHVTREATTVESTTAKSSFVLSFGDGTVTGCRGQKVASYLDGPKVAHADRYEEQQGYRGKWSRDGLWLDVELTPNNTVCKQLRRYANLEPKIWMMRCLSIVRGRALHMPVLICRVTHIAESQFREAYAHTLTKILPGEWMVLATGNGAHVTWHEEGVGLFTEKNAVVSVSKSATPIVENTWEN